MPTALYIGENPMNQFPNSLIKKIDQGKSIIGKGMIGEYIKSISFKVHELAGTDVQIIPDLNNTETLRGKGDYSTREFLKDTQNTFGLFTQCLYHANSQLKAGKNVSVGLYKEDIQHKEFVKQIHGVTEQGEYAKSLTIEISKEPYGSLNPKSINNLQEISSLGVGVGIEDFNEKPNGEIDIDTITRIIKGKIKPRYIKMSESVINKINNNEVIPSIVNLYKGLVSMGVKIIKYTTGIGLFNNDNVDNGKQKIAKSLIDRANIEYEPMLTYEGKVVMEELLIRFEDQRTDEGLNTLKELGNTHDLVIKMLIAGIKRAKIGNKVSINLYIKDLWSNKTIEKINEITQFLTIEHKNNIIFEILEEKFGIIDDQFSSHVEALQKDGFRIAIDDLYVSDDINGMSLEILDKLLEAGIYPDYLKLDGRHSMAIQNNTISTIELTKIKTLIGQFAMEKPITLVAEWIQNREHAKKIKDLFGQIEGVTIIYQGREINESNFDEKSE